MRSAVFYLCTFTFAQMLIQMLISLQPISLPRVPYPPYSLSFRCHVRSQIIRSGSIVDSKWTEVRRTRNAVIEEGSYYPLLAIDPGRQRTQPWSLIASISRGTGPMPRDSPLFSHGPPTHPKAMVANQWGLFFFSSKKLLFFFPFFLAHEELDV